MASMAVLKSSGGDVVIASPWLGLATSDPTARRLNEFANRRSVGAGDYYFDLSHFRQIVAVLCVFSCMRFLRKSRHGWLCDLIGRDQCYLVVQWADLFALGVHLGVVVTVNECGDPGDQFIEGDEGVPLVVLMVAIVLSHAPGRRRRT